MRTQCSAKSFEFARVESRAFVAAFDGGAVTSDAGGPLLGVTDRAIGLSGRFAACFSDHRRADLIEHQVRTLVSQRISPARMPRTDAFFTPVPQRTDQPPPFGR
jgi:hypothetical protein